MAWKDKSKEEIAAYNREYRQKNKKKVAAQQKKYYEDHKDDIREWRNTYRQNHLDRHNESGHNWKLRNPDKVRESRRRYAPVYKLRRKTHPEIAERAIHLQNSKIYGDPKRRLRRIVQKIIRRCESIGKPFDTDLLEFVTNPVRTHCECCGEVLSYHQRPKDRPNATGKHHPRGPSLDRVDNTGGYTKGNVSVICFECNRIKGPWTLEQHENVARYMRSRIKR